MNPIFFEKTKDGEKAYDISSRLLKERVIVLETEINDEVTNEIISLLYLLGQESDDKINFWINSPGGDADGCFAIYDMMQRVKAPISTICVGSASSAASILLASGTKGLRYATPNSRIMIHQIQVKGMGGTTVERDIINKELKSMQSRLTEILARHTGHTISRINKDTINDKHFSAEAAIKYGLVDKILKPAKAIPELIIKEPTKKGNNASK